jgi:hypothetical protein
LAVHFELQGCLTVAVFSLVVNFLSVHFVSKWMCLASFCVYYRSGKWILLRRVCWRNKIFLLNSAVKACVVRQVFAPFWYYLYGPGFGPWRDWNRTLFWGLNWSRFSVATNSPVPHHDPVDNESFVDYSTRWTERWEVKIYSCQPDPPRMKKRWIQPPSVDNVATEDEEKMICGWGWRRDVIQLMFGWWLS